MQPFLKDKGINEMNQPLFLLMLDDNIRNFVNHQTTPTLSTLRHVCVCMYVCMYIYIYIYI